MPSTFFLIQFTNDHEWNLSVGFVDEPSVLLTSFVLLSSHLFSFYFIVSFRITSEP